MEAVSAVPMTNSGCSADTESAHECLALSVDNHAGGTRRHDPSPPQQPMAIAINTGTALACACDTWSLLSILEFGPKRAFTYRDLR